jgi:hypothetical protein
MDAKQILKKLRLRLNKLDTNFSKSIDNKDGCELYNKARIDYIANKLRSEDANKSIIHTLQALNTQVSVSSISYDIYTSFKIPKDFIWISNIQCIDSICKKSIKCHLIGMSDVSEKYHSATWQPSHVWEETFYTLSSDEIRLYKKEFEIEQINLSYYKKPLPISMIEGEEIGCIFTDDIVEDIIDLAVIICASDIGDASIFQSKASLMQSKLNK